MSQPAAATWTEPPWSGWIETTGDALLILEAARRGLIPRVTRRLVDSERKMITSGSVFVFDEDESGIKRWTDGFFWSPSRILGNFLLYRETDKRGTGHNKGSRSQEPVEGPAEASQSPTAEASTLSRPRVDTSNNLGFDKLRERSLMGSLTNSPKFKSDGLMKKTFSLHIGGVAQHLISYYRIEDVESGRLRSPSSLPELASLDISPEYLDKTHFRNPPKVEVGPDGVPRYRGEADDVETSPRVITTPLSSGLPLLTDGRVAESKRAVKRFDPYGNPPHSKRQRKHPQESPEPGPPASASPDDRRSSSSQTPTPPTPHAMPPPQTYPDPNVPSTSAAAAAAVVAHPQQPYNGYYPIPSYGRPPQHVYTYPIHAPGPPPGPAPVPPPAPTLAQSTPQPPMLATYSHSPYTNTGSAPHSNGGGPPAYYGYYHPPGPYGYPTSWTSYAGYAPAQPPPPPSSAQQQQQQGPQAEQRQQQQQPAMASASANTNAAAEVESGKDS